MPLVNVYCRNKGWLFEDLKQLIASKGAVASDEPMKSADAWICIRDTEALASPDPWRTLVQCHHVNDFPHTSYGMLSFCHPFQQRKFAATYGNGYAQFMLPIGARDVDVSPRTGTPTLGYFCREVGRDRKKGSEVFMQAVAIARQHMPFNVLMIGENLEHIAHLGVYERRAAVPNDYMRISAFCTTSTSPAVPLSCYESLAAGVPVATTPREFPHEFKGIFTGGTAEGLAMQIIKALQATDIHPEKPFSRDAWAKRQFDEGLKLCQNR